MDRVTNLKAQYISEHGYEFTGYILTNPDTGNRVFVEHGRVIWLEKEQAELVLGHTTEDTELPDKYPSRKKYTEPL